MSMEFVIEGNRRAAVEEKLSRIKQLFDVQISIANGTGEKVWITLKEGQVEKAKIYIQALTSPDRSHCVSIPTSLVKTLGLRSKEHSNLESEYGVVITFPQETRAHIAGTEMNVIMASSKLDDLIQKHSKASQPKANRPLEDFALKLGYEQEQINQVFEKLGPTVNRDTFLNELITVSRAGTRDDRWSPVSTPRSATTSRPDQFGANGLYGGDHGIASRGVISRSSVNTRPSNGPQAYHAQVGNGINPYNRELGALPMHNDAIIARGFLPRTTGPSTQAINANASGVVARGIMPRTTASSTQGSDLTTDAVTRAYTPRTTSQTTQGSNSTYSNSSWSNGLYSPQGSEYGSNSVPPQVEQMVNQMASRYQQLPQSDLRHVVIDGSNVAMSHGNNKVFSCRGIALCVEWFRSKGHKQITVFVPSWRKESSKMDNPITDQHILYQLEEQGCLTFTPSRKVNGRRIVCYDDRYLIKLAESTNGIIVSNDNFKDLASENPKWRDVIEQRLLMYSFVNDMFMPPDDPLGRHGPNLDEFLHKGTQTHRRVCPYGRRCTYGTRCKYHHPEREDTRLPIYLNLKTLFPNQETLILSVMKKYPQEKDANKLASYVLSMMQ